MTTKWTNEFPTVPGWYWVRFSVPYGEEHTRAFVVEVKPLGRGLMAMTGGTCVAGAMWGSEPIPEPSFEEVPR